MPNDLMEQKQQHENLYIVTKTDYAEVEGNRKDIDMVGNESKLSKLIKKNNLSAVCQQISKYMPNVYTDFQQKVLKKEDYKPNPDIQDAKVLELRCSRGTRMEQENDILDFSLAGSGFDQFRREHRGKNEVGHGKITEKSIRKKVEKEYNAKKKVGTWRKFCNFFALKSSQYYKNTQKMKEEDAELLESIKDRYKTEYSDEIERVSGKKNTYVENFGNIEEVRKKTISQSRVKYSISGPVAGLKKGMSNSGVHSIENNRKYVLELASAYLTPKFEQWKSKLEHNESFRPVLIRLKGHSRGGVGAAEGAMMIRAWIREQYPQYLDYVKFDLVQFDPVPGTGSAHGINERIDLAGEEIVKEGKDEFLGLGDSAETSVIYTPLSNHNLFFTPQKVLGAKRIFITLDIHDVGLQHIDSNMSMRKGKWDDKSGDQPKNAGHAQVYVDMETATAYSQSSLNDMPPGVYLVDAKNRVIRVKSPEMAEFMVRKMRTEQKDGKDKKESSNQTERRDVILSSVKDWFERDTSIPVEERNQENIGMYLRDLKAQGIEEFADEKYEVWLKILNIDLTANERVEVLSKIAREVTGFQLQNQKVEEETVNKLLEVLTAQIDIYRKQIQPVNAD